MSEVHYILPNFYTWWTLSVVREVTTWIFSWSSLNYRVGQKVTKFGIFGITDLPLPILDMLTVECFILWAGGWCWWKGECPTLCKQGGGIVWERETAGGGKNMSAERGYVQR